MITLEKEQYFAQYWGQRVFNTNHKLYPVGIATHYHKAKGYLELADLKNISNEDAINVAKMHNLSDANEKQVLIDYGKSCVIGDTFMIIQIYQYLQSKGYALPFRQYSVQDLINEGVLKLQP